MSPIRIRLKEVRELRGLSVMALADKSGVRRQTIMQIEKAGGAGTTRVALETLESLANALDIDAALLIEHDRGVPGVTRWTAGGKK